MEKTKQTRRNFIATLIALPIAMLGLWRYLNPKRPDNPALLRLPAADLPAGGMLVFRNERIAVMQENNEVIAMKLVCTHLGCTVTVTPQGMICPCHGSRFDRMGNVQNGPAERPLERLAVKQDGDMLVISG